MSGVRNWHTEHQRTLSRGDLIADAVAAFVGSWKFIVIQSVLMICWVIVNTLWLFNFARFDPFPFVFLNLFMSAEAAYSTPFIMMSQNRQSQRDRVQAEHDYQVNRNAEREVRELQVLMGELHRKFDQRDWEQSHVR